MTRVVCYRCGLPEDVETHQQSWGGPVYLKRGGKVDDDCLKRPYVYGPNQHPFERAVLKRVSPEVNEIFNLLTTHTQGPSEVGDSDGPG